MVDPASSGFLAAVYGLFVLFEEFERVEPLFLNQWLRQLPLLVRVRMCVRREGTRERIQLCTAKFSCVAGIYDVRVGRERASRATRGPKAVQQRRLESMNL